MTQRRRYIAFEVAANVNGASVSRAVNFLCANQPKSDRALVKLVLYDENSRLGLLRCGHRQLDQIKTSMAGADVGAKKPPFRVIGVSGTIKAAKRKFLAPRQEKD